MNKKMSPTLIKSSNLIFIGCGLYAIDILLAKRIDLIGLNFWFLLFAISLFIMVSIGLGIRFGYTWLKDILYLSILCLGADVIINFTDNLISSITRILQIITLIGAVFFINKTKKINSNEINKFIK